MTVKTKSDFSITINFDKNSPNPARVFQSMSLMLETFEQFDKDLVRHIDSKIDTVLLLEDIERGSLKTLLVNVLKGIPDDSIKDFEWKKIVGHFILKAKYIVLKKLEGKIEITSGDDIEVIEMELVKAAKETGVDQLPSYVPTSKKAIIKNIDSINKALEPLSKKDKVSYESEFGRAAFNLKLNIDYEKMEDLITNEVIESESTMILKVKKPDYLGDSMWLFKHGSKFISAKILHQKWLDDFQDRKIDVRPQDSLVCIVKITAKYDYNFELINVYHEILKVTKINPRPNDSQMNLEFKKKT